MNEGFPEYGNSRFPKKQPKGFCRGCRLAIDPKLEPRAQTWHNSCKKLFDPFHVRQAVRRRAGGKCEKCHHPLPLRNDYRWRLNELSQEHNCRVRELKTRRAEYDHIIPHSEGGLFTVDNIRILCRKCHLEITAAWLKEKASRRRQNIVNPP